MEDSETERKRHVMEAQGLASSGKPNREGLTFLEWAAAAGFSVRSYLEVRKATLLAWFFGEDPSDWRKAGERAAEQTLDAETE